LAVFSTLGYCLLNTDVEEIPITLRVPAVSQVGHSRDQTLPCYIHTEAQL